MSDSLLKRAIKDYQYTSNMHLMFFCIFLLFEILFIPLQLVLYIIERYLNRNRLTLRKATN
jgi:hypothetical protein